MRTPHRRDISARQDLLGRELRELFDGYTNEDVPDELMRLAEQLQSAFEQRPPGADAQGRDEHGPDSPGPDEPDGAHDAHPEPEDRTD